MSMTVRGELNHDRLNTDLSTILADQAKGNILSITKSDRKGATIEITNRDPLSFETYVYKDNIGKRDRDYNEIILLIQIQNEKKQREVQSLC